jgi:hypothetical protein
LRVGSAAVSDGRGRAEAQPKRTAKKNKLETPVASVVVPDSQEADKECPSEEAVQVADVGLASSGEASVVCSTDSGPTAPAAYKKPSFLAKK